MFKNVEVNKIEETKENNPNLNNSSRINNNNNKYTNSNSLPSCINSNISGFGASTNFFSATSSATSKTFESNISNNNSIDAVNQYIQKYMYDPDYTHQDFRNADQTLRLEVMFKFKINSFLKLFFNHSITHGNIRDT